MSTKHKSVLHQMDDLAQTLATVGQTLADQAQAKVLLDQSQQCLAQIRSQLLDQSLDYLLLTENVPEVLWLLSPDPLEVEYVNPAYERIWERSRENVYAQSWSWLEAVHPEDRQKVRNTLEQEAWRQSCVQEYRIVLPSGATRWIRDRIFPVCDSSGKVARLVRISEDMTARKRSEVALQDSEERFRSYFELSLIGIAITSPSKGWLEVNDCLCRIFGHPREELVQLTWADITHPDDLAADVAEFERVLAGEIEGYSMDKRFVRPDGSIIYASIDVKCLRNQDNSVDYFIALVQDITDRKRAQDDAQKHREALAHVSRVSTMGEMATGIAHELNQPLSAIVNYSFAATTLLEQSDLEVEEVRRIMQCLKDQAVRAGKIVQRVRGFVNKSEVQYEAVNLEQLVREVVKFVDLNIRHNSITLALDFEDSSTSVMVDPIQIQQVMVNLVRNAIDALDSTPVERRVITITTRDAQNHQAEVAVSDSGKGMNREEFEHVFDAFFTTKEEGMGMGLAISRSIIQTHGGHLWAEPNLPQGVTFGFLLPLAAR